MKAPVSKTGIPVNPVSRVRISPCPFIEEDGRTGGQGDRWPRGLKILSACHPVALSSMVLDGWPSGLRRRPGKPKGRGGEVRRDAGVHYGSSRDLPEFPTPETGFCWNEPQANDNQATTICGIATNAACEGPTASASGVRAYRAAATRTRRPRSLGAGRRIRLLVGSAGVRSARHRWRCCC